MTINRFYLMLFIVIFGVTLGLIIWQPERVNPDVALFTVTADWILDGQRPYVDFYLMNFPTIQYLHVIPLWIGNTFGMSGLTWVLLLTWGLSAWSVWVTYKLSQQFIPDKKLVDSFLIPLAIAIYSLSLLPINEYAQREHIFILVFIPFLLIRMMRWWHEDTELSFKYGLLYGFVAGIGLSIKPHFALIPIILELFWLLRLRKVKLLFAPEIYGVLLALLIFVTYYAFNPAVLKGQIKILEDVNKGNYASYPLATLYFTPTGIKLIALVLPLVFFWQRNLLLFFSHIFVLVTIVGFIIVVMQGRGFPYHWIIYEISFYISMSFFVLWFFNEKVFKDLKLRPQVVSLANISLSSVVIFVLITLNVNNTLETPTYTQTEEDRPFIDFSEKSILAYSNAGDEVLILARNPGAAYSILPRTDRIQIASYTVAYPLVLEYEESIYEENTHLPEAVEQTTQDIREHEPSLIMFDDAVNQVYIAQNLPNEVLYPNYAIVDQYKLFVIYIKMNTPQMLSTPVQIGNSIEFLGSELPTQVKACESLEVTTIWQRIEETEQSVQLEVVLLADDEIVSQQTSSLTVVPLADWLDRVHYMDKRHLTIPCTTPAGEYEVGIQIYVGESTDEMVPIQVEGNDTVVVLDQIQVSAD